MDVQANLLTLEFFEWISSRPRAYADVMEAWRTTCPRHPIWEDALLNGLIQLESRAVMDQCVVTLTPKGRTLLEGNASSRSQSRERQPADDGE